MYSAHDDNIANTILFLQPYNYPLSYVPFASSMLFELHYDDQCVATKKDRSCFTLMIYHDNVPLKFESCLDANAKRGSRSDFCQVDDFLQYFNSIKFTGDIEKYCTQTYTPPA